MGTGRNSGWGGRQLSRLVELQEELRTVLFGRGAGFLDALLPLVIYLLASRLFDLGTGIWASVGIALLLFIIRLYKRQSMFYTLAGLVSVLIAAAAGYFSGEEGGFFIPGLFSGILTIAFCFGSVLIKRPIAAYSSHLARRWPLEWYWHPRIRPAYLEVSLFWAVGFSVRLVMEGWLYETGRTISLGLVRTFLGWPYTILILILSYLYGIWRLKNLGGPGVREFLAGVEEPWEGQTRGF